MWPKFSNIDDTIYNKIQNGAPSEPNDSIQSTVSKKVCWVRVISGANQGLIMYSNPDWKIFAAVGDDAKSAYIYGDGTNSGALGVDWKGRTVKANDGWAGRPSPIITGLSVKEGQDQISRHAELSLTCYTRGQMELIQEYLMEPGYTLVIEYGYNTDASVQHILEIDKSQPLKLRSRAGEANLDQDTLHERRIDSNGEYDSFMGFIVGGTTSANGSSFDITVKLRGAPGLPTWLQSQHNISQYKNDKGKLSLDNNKTAPNFAIIDLNMTDSNVKGYIAERRFKYMFNALPQQRKSYTVQNLLFKGFTGIDFLNMDAVISNKINAFKEAQTVEDSGGIVTTESKEEIDKKKEEQKKATGGAPAPALSADVITAGGYHIPKEKIFSDKEFIRFEKAIQILNANDGINSYIIGGRKIPVTIDISDCIIGAFPYIYSTDSEKLIIVGKVPNFNQFFLSEYEVVLKPPLTANNTVDISPDPAVTFVQEKDATIDEHGYQEVGGHWGYLKNLYINFKLFKEAMEDQNLTMRQVLEKLLNEMSSAVNGFWNFQIVEKNTTLPDKKGNPVKTTRYTVIDENFIGQNATEVKEFWHNGENSRFLSATLTIDVPSAMTNQIVAKRLEYATNPNAPTLKVGGIFTSNRDLFLEIDAVAGNEPPKQQTGENAVPPKSARYSYRDEDNEYHEKSINFVSDSLGQKWADNKAAQAAHNDEGLKKVNDLKLIAQEKRKKYDDAVAALAIAAAQQSGTGIVGEIIGEYIVAPVVVSDNEPLLKEANEAKKAYEDGQKAWDEETKKLSQNNLDIIAENEKAREANISSNFDKVTILPDPLIVDIPDDDLSKSVVDSAIFDKYFNIYTCKDTTFFNILKENSTSGGNSKTGRYSHPLPIKYEFTIHGTSGIRRGDTFNIIGIPEKYRENGLFQVTEVEQSLQNNTWTTKVVGAYRQQQ
jgi:hypothetical protein